MRSRCSKKFRGGIRGQMSMPRTFLAFAISRREITIRRARHLEKCSTFLETRPPRIYLQRACYCGKNTIRWRKNMRRRRSRSIPNCRWRISCSASCTSTNRARTRQSRSSRKNWPSTRRTRQLIKLADAYSRVQKFEDAERLLQRSIWLDSTSTGPFILMGKVLEKKGEYELAVRALQRAATMDPNNPTTHHLLGQAYRDMGKKEEAESELKLAEELQTKSGAR